MLLSDNALAVLRKRYFKKDDQGNPLEDWHLLLTRVASNISGGDSQKKKAYYELMDSGYFLPNSPTLMNAGSDLQQLSACFVLPIDDSMEGIFDTIKNAALIHKSGGGTGFSFSKLREANSRVRSTKGVSSGPISFLKVYNAATDAVKQGGTRRGANMAILNVDHPEILDFITCKEDPEELTNFNISVGLSEEFMLCVHDDKDFDLVSPHTGERVQTVKAREIFDLIVDMAYKNGEPGIVFMDRINKFNPTPHIGRIDSTNPCGEQPLLPNEACNLGSINLAAMVKNGRFDFDILQNVVRDSVSFLDDVIDRSRFPLPEIDAIVKSNRKIGLGIMGWADLLYQLEIPYNSEQATELAEEIMEFIDYHSKVRSMELAGEKGSFPNFDGSIYSSGSLIRNNRKQDWTDLKKKIGEQGIRNATTTTIAPTGTIGMIANTSGGIEPQFSLVYVKSVMDGEKLLYVNPYFKKAVEDAGIYSDELMEKVSQQGSISDIDEIPENLRRIFVTAHDINPEWHIKMQAAFQKYTDNAVSKTINFPSKATREDIKMAYELAYESGCKGVTVYRDGSRDNQVLNVGKNLKKELNGTRVAPRHRPNVTAGVTQKIETGCGHLYVTINSDEKGPCELFTQMGKVGGCASAQLEAIARLVSLCLRSNVQVTSIIRQLRGIRCPSPMWHQGEMVTSCGDSVAKSLETFLKISQNAKQSIDEINKNVSETKQSSSFGRINGTCPDCGSNIEHSEGCLKCNICGWTKC
jgi:ribonucleoside-diphosphate reductase alpha chain